MNKLKQYSGVALIVVGALLLITCFVARCESNTELLSGLLLILLGTILHVRQMKQGEKY